MVYAISNLHGCYDKWIHMLKEIKFTDRDDMYVLGDVVDYGDEPMELLFDMMERHNVYPIMGEHEYKFLSFVKDFPVKNSMDTFAASLSSEKIPEFTSWIKNGGRPTFEGYMKLDAESRKAVLEYLDEFMLYDSCVAGDNSFMFFHSGIKDFDESRDLGDYDISSFLSENNIEPQKYYKNKYTVVGHTPTFILDKEKVGKIYIKGKFIDIDCGAFYHSTGGKLGCLRLDDFKEFYV